MLLMVKTAKLFVKNSSCEVNSTYSIIKKEITPKEEEK